MSGLKWLNGRTWGDITRDERTFCAELFFLVRSDLPAFIAYLNHQHGANLDARANWEIAYEAVFYRDLAHLRRDGEPSFSPKRTFDLALFSDDDVLIIEAKAQQGFDSKQMAEFEADAEQVKRLTGARTVRLAGLVSSLYRPRATTRTRFDGPFLTWSELAEFYGGNAVLARADAIYGRGPS